MSHMQFKLIFQPPRNHRDETEMIQHVEKFSELFKVYIKNYSVDVKACDILRMAKDEGSLPQFTELEVEMTAIHDVRGGNVKAYQHLSRKWIDLSRSWCESYVSLPLLMISDRKAFQKTTWSVHKRVPVQDIKFGIMPFPCEFISLASLNNLNSVSFKGEIDFCHDQSKVDIPLKYNLSDWLLTFSYRNIRRILVNFEINGTVELYLDLLHPPIVYQKETKRSRRIGAYEVLKRKPELSKLTKNIIGRANILNFTLLNTDETTDIISRLHFRCRDLPVYYAHITKTVNSRISPNFVNSSLSFSNFACQYLLEAIFGRNFSTYDQCCRLDGTTLNELNACVTSTQIKHVEKALIDILFAIDSGKCVYFPYALTTLCKYYGQHVESNNFNNYIIPEKSRLIRRATITPTRLLLWPPEIMFENRVLRNYDPEFALRINFRDDDMSRLSWMALYADEAIFNNAITNPMRSGVSIGNRNFQFLGWSNSQIRDHGVWCYATDNLRRSVGDIRQWMGDFSHIKTVPKYMARMGQSFSQTEDSISVPLNSNHVRVEQDITGGTDRYTMKPYCFSDGVGKISQELANKVHETLGHDRHCSAFQIRYGGCKGMLAIDPTLKNADIVFRDSMKKFDSPQNIRLEIAKTSAPIPLQLNRPFITLLNQMGIPPRILLRLQEDYLRKLTDILLDEEQAVKYLREKSPLDVLKFEDLSKAGIELTVEPFFRQLLLALHTFHIGKIKTHANIAIDPSVGRNMLGVLDETRTLEYGQVFVQYSRDISFGETTTDTVIQKGTVLVTKNPCMHPGDVRKFTAVDVPALHHIVDCIVFPQKGPRPHPNEMAGSDLDGDEYAVIWTKDLIFHRSHASPGDYPSFSAPEKMWITDHDMIEFLVEYIKNDQVGVIANAHLAHADKYGINNHRCLSIAEKFSVAVDYAKNGTKRQLGIDEKPQEFPDFMEKSYKKTYKSDKALGKLFRVCKDFEGTNIKVSLEAPVVKVDPLLAYPGWERYQCEAVKSRDKYISLLSLILQTYGVQHEAEAFSGAYTEVHCRFQERKDRAEVEKVVNASIKALCKNMKKEFHSHLEVGNPNEDLLAEEPHLVTSLLQKASAWYMVTYGNPDIGVLSFPWIVSNYLADIKIQKLYPNISTGIRTPIIDRINVVIYNNLASIPYLTSDGMRELNKYNFVDLMERDIVEVALRVLMLWAYDCYIIQEEGYSNRGFLYRKVFAQLFIHIMEQEKKKAKSSSNRVIGQISAAAYCLAFLRFCVSLRFCDKHEVQEYLPFRVYKYKELATQAMISYHDIAITGIFYVLKFDQEQNDGLIEMKQEYIDTSVFGSMHLSTEFLLGMKKELETVCGIQEISLREYHSTKKIIVSALGTYDAIVRLKRILRKEVAIAELVQSVRSRLALA